MNTKDPDTGKLLNPRQATLEAMDLLGAGSGKRTGRAPRRPTLTWMWQHRHDRHRVRLPPNLFSLAS